MPTAAQEYHNDQKCSSEVNLSYSARIYSSNFPDSAEILHTKKKNWFGNNMTLKKDFLFSFSNLIIMHRRLLDLIYLQLDICVLIFT